MTPNHIGGGYGPQQPYTTGPSYPRPGVNPGYQQPGPFGPTSTNPYGFMKFFQTLMGVMNQLFGGWGQIGNPYPQPQPQPFPNPYIPPNEPPIAALYGVSIGPNPGPWRPIEPPIAALYGVAIGPGPWQPTEPPIAALYGVSIGPGGGGPPVQALYGVAFAG